MTNLLRVAGVLEGLSFLVLLGVAMPMKYVWGNPNWIAPIGMAHGVLFLLYVAVLLVTSHKMNWAVGTFVLGLLAAILPFGPFVFDAYIHRTAAKAVQ